MGDEGFRLAGLRSTFSGASAHDLCRVATGTADAYVDIVNTEACWDYLAAALIVTDHDGVDYAGLCAAMPLVVDTRDACGRRGLRGVGIVKA